MHLAQKITLGFDMIPPILIKMAAIKANVINDLSKGFFTNDVELGFAT